MQGEVEIPLATAESMPCTECGRTFPVQRVPPFSRIFCSACGREQSAAGQLGAYLVLGLLGQGGMGAVFRGLDPALDRPVAIKLLTQDAAAGPDALEQFRREAKAAAQINHANVARIFAFGIEQRKPYIVMEFVDGRSVMDLIEERGPLDVPFVLHIAIQAAEGLAAAAANGLVHGDVKPENILVSENGTAKLIDFGLASLANQPGSREIWGTPYYISPERLKPGQQIDFRSDLYSLGGTIYHALTGKPPFEGTSAVEVAKARLTRMPPSPSEVRPSVDPAASNIVMRALQREPGARYPSYDSMVGDMRRVSATLGGYARRKKRSGILVSARQTSSIIMPRQETRKRSALVPLLLAAFALLSVGGAALFFLSGPAPPMRPPPAPPLPDPVSVDPVALPTPSNERPTLAAASVTTPQVGSVRLFAWRDEATVEPNASVLIDVLDNDAHPDGIAPEVTEVTDPPHGRATITSNGKVSYRPKPGYIGTDTFGYTIRHSSGQTAKSSVTVTIAKKTPPPSPPAAPPPPRHPETNQATVLASAQTAASNATASATGMVEVATEVEPPWPSDPIKANFSPDDLIPYAAARGGGVKGSSIILDDGRRIWLKGHIWQALPIRYSVTTNTVLEFSVSLKRTGEVHSIGLDSQCRTMGDERLFQLAGGAQTRSNRDYFSPRSAPFDFTYRIPVGRYSTGPRSYLVIGSSDSSQAADISFSDVRIYEYTNVAATVAGSHTPSTPPESGRQPSTAAPQKRLVPGLKFTLRERGKNEILKSGNLPSLQFDPGKGSILGSGRSDNVDAEFTGLLNIPKEGPYRFVISANDSAELLVDNKSLGKAELDKDLTTGEIPLTIGRHPLTIRLHEGTAECFLRVKWIQPGRSLPEAIPSTAIVHEE